MDFKRLLATLSLLALLGCASASKPSARADDELKTGVQVAQRGYWQEALFRFSRARDLKPTDAEVLNNLAVAQEALGKYDDALATYKQALAIAPKSTVIRRNYARFAEFFTSYARGVKPKGGSDAPR
ncbi:MAG: tetratricopeptide repeat protein [Acidobacteriota bacterium]